MRLHSDTGLHRETLGPRKPAGIATIGGACTADIIIIGSVFGANRTDVTSLGEAVSVRAPRSIRS